MFFKPKNPSFLGVSSCEYFHWGKPRISGGWHYGLCARDWIYKFKNSFIQNQVRLKHKMFILKKNTKKKTEICYDFMKFIQIHGEKYSMSERK